jgi:hypothetical protein
MFFTIFLTFLLQNVVLGDNIKSTPISRVDEKGNLIHVEDDIRKPKEYVFFFAESKQTNLWT